MIEGGWRTYADYGQRYKKQLASTTKPAG